jgi:hypothetical protein
MELYVFRDSFRLGSFFAVNLTVLIAAAALMVVSAVDVASSENSFGGDDDNNDVLGQDFELTCPAAAGAGASAGYTAEAYAVQGCRSSISQHGLSRCSLLVLSIGSGGTAQLEVAVAVTVMPITFVSHPSLFRCIPLPLRFIC